MSLYDNPDRRELDPQETRDFALAGKSTFTLLSVKTGRRFTYKVKAYIDRNGDYTGRYYVKVLRGSDNEQSYTFLGTIFADSDHRYFYSRKSKIGYNAPSAVAFAWAWPRILAGNVPDGLAIWHEGSCARCGRKLTVPSSVASGYGPICITKAA